MSVRPDEASLADRLRTPYKTLILPGDIGYMLADAIEIADSGARSDIEILCKPITHLGARWYDSTDHDPPMSDTVVQALRYLDARGLIERDAFLVHIVRFPPPQ